MKLNMGDAIGLYRIERAISRGGMSYIFLVCLQERPAYQAALKFNASEKSQFQDLLRREADVLTRLRHPNIVRIFPLRLEKRSAYYTARAKDVENQPWYFAMEYLEGGSLDEHIGLITHFPVGWRIELFYQLLITVQFIHQNGFAHTDLKPENIVLRHYPEADRRPQPVIIDFGSVSPLDRRARLSASIHYSPPEVIRALRNGALEAEELPPAKADIWALGAILYELLAGEPLVLMDDPEAAMDYILQGNFPAVRNYQRDIPESLDFMLGIMLHPEAQSRPGVGELISAVEEKIASVCPPRIPLRRAT